MTDDLNRSIRAQAGRRRRTSMLPADPANAGMNAVLRGARLRGDVTPGRAPAPAIAPDDARAYAVEAGRRLGYRNPDLAARIVTGITDHAAIDDELRTAARQAPELVRHVDFGGGPRGTPLPVPPDMNAAIRDEAAFQIGRRDARRNR